MLSKRLVKRERGNGGRGGSDGRPTVRPNKEGYKGGRAKHYPYNKVFPIRALATERVHQKRFIAGSLIHLLFSTPPGGYRLLHFPRNSMCQKCTTSKYSRPRLFRCNEKTAPTIFPQIAHDRGIVDPRTCANFLKKIRCRFCATGAGRKMRTGGRGACT